MLGKLGKYEDSIKAYDKTIELEPTYANAYSNKGLALGQLGQYEEAIKVFDKAIELNPHNADAIKNRELAQKLMKDAD